MDRLTNPNFTKACCDPWDYCGLDKDCRRDCKGCKLPAQIYRLAMYEDTGFVPAEIEALLGHQSQAAPPVRKRQRVQIVRCGDRDDLETLNNLLAEGWQVSAVSQVQGFSSSRFDVEPYTEYLLEREEADDGH